MTSKAVIILTTTSGAADAEIIARKLVESRLAACVQIVERVKSVYAWEGRVESASENLLVIKSCEERYSAIEAMIKTIHTENSWYQTPEIVRVTATGGSDEYLAWLFDSVRALDGT